MKQKAFFSALLLIVSLAIGASGVYKQPSSLAWSNPVDITGGVSRNKQAFGVMACDPYQNVHLFWGDQTDGTGGAAIFYRNNANGSWSFPNDVIVASDSNINYLRSAISPFTDIIYLTWVNAIFNGTMYFSSAPLSRAEEPLAWLAPKVIASGVTNSDIAIDAMGNIHLIYSSSDEVGINNEVYHTVSSDNGKVWSEPELVFSRTFSQPSSIQVWLDIDGKGRLHLGLTLRSQAYGVTSEVGYMRTLDDGKTWDEYVMIQDQGTTFQGVAWIEPFAFGDDEIHLTWHDPRRMHQWSKDGGRTWSLPEEIMPLGGAFGGPNVLTKDSAGILHVVLAISDGVFSVEWKNERWSAPEQIDSRYIDPHGQQIIACGGNQLHVIFYDRTGDETEWYSTRFVRGDAIEQRPIPEPTLDPTSQVVEASKELTNATATPTVYAAKETLVASQSSPPATTRFTLAKLLSGVLPAVIVVLAAIVVALLKVRR